MATSGCETDLVLSAPGGVDLILSVEQRELQFNVAGGDLTLSADECDLTLAAITEAEVVFEPIGESLTVQTEGIVLELGCPIPVGTGESNTASNVGGGDAGVFKQKTGIDLEFRELRSQSPARLKIEETDPPCVVDFTLALDKCGVVPSGLIDGVNVTYTFPEFVDPSSVKVYRNGVRLVRDDGGSCDYSLSESGGPGAGYDTLTITDSALDSDENLVTDYVATL